MIHFEEKNPQWLSQWNLDVGEKNLHGKKWFTIWIERFVLIRSFGSWKIFGNLYLTGFKYLEESICTRDVRDWFISRKKIHDSVNLMKFSEKNLHPRRKSDHLTDVKVVRDWLIWDKYESFVFVREWFIMMISRD